MAENIKLVEFERGDKVNHPKWGLGTILYKSGSGDKTKIIVLFSEAGQKTLMVKFASLEKIAAGSAGKTKDYPLPKIDKLVDELIEDEDSDSLEKKDTDYSEDEDEDES